MPVLKHRSPCSRDAFPLSSASVADTSRTAIPSPLPPQIRGARAGRPPCWTPPNLTASSSHPLATRDPLHDHEPSVVVLSCSPHLFTLGSPFFILHSLRLPPRYARLPYVLLINQPRILFLVALFRDINSDTYKKRPRNPGQGCNAYIEHRWQ